TATTASCAGSWRGGRWPMCWLWLQTSACGNRILCNIGWMQLRGVCPHLDGSAFPPVSAARANGSMIGRWCNCRNRMVGLGRFWCGAASKRSQSALTICVTLPPGKTRLKRWSEWLDNAGCSNNPLTQLKANAGWITTKCATGRAGIGTSRCPCWPMQCYPCCERVEKKLQTHKCGSPYPNCATCSPRCYGAGGTELSTCCIGPSGEDDINSELCAATIESEDRLCPH